MYIILGQEVIVQILNLYGNKCTLFRNNSPDIGL